MNLYIFDPTKTDQVSQFRGGGRIIQILKENLPEAKFINDLDALPSRHDRDRTVKSNIFINPLFNPFQPPLSLKRIAPKQIQIIFDVIPLKYPSHFPTGIRGKLNLFLNKLALRNYDKIITISNHSKKEIAQYLKIQEDKIEVVYPTLGKIFLNTKSEIPNSKFQIPNSFCLYVGDVNWNKNLVNLARAIKIINVTCVFVGKAFSSIISSKGNKIFAASQLSEQATGGAGGRAPNSAQRSEHWREGNPRQNLSRLQSSHPWQKEFRDFLIEVDDDKRFVFLGYVPDSQLIKLYQQARVNVLISRDEGFGFSFLEAASQSCPSVLSDIEVFHETAADSAWFANPNDPHDIANKIGEIYFNNDLRETWGAKAEKRAKVFSKERFKKDLFKAILK